jgi:hypothetical protein
LKQTGIEHYVTNDILGGRNVQNTAGNRTGSTGTIRPHAGKRTRIVLSHADYWDRFLQHILVYDAHDHDDYDDGYPYAHDEGHDRIRQGIGITATNHKKLRRKIYSV